MSKFVQNSFVLLHNCVKQLIFLPVISQLPRFQLKKLEVKHYFSAQSSEKRLVIPEFQVSGHHLMHLSHYITFRSTLELRITSLHLCGWIDLECTGTTMYDIPLES